MNTIGGLIKTAITLLRKISLFKLQVWTFLILVQILTAVEKQPMKKSKVNTKKIQIIKIT